MGAVQFSVAAGFGLFAILALFTLRSEPITKIEIAYFFGSIALAVITAVQGTVLPFCRHRCCAGGHRRMACGSSENPRLDLRDQDHAR
ncbi:DUF4956 domain-containing protein [Cypionkella sp. TWP1-2-1b2]|uniref:DUF4956 domain-containing protein n=1 Tax=Cypionkella sp. TWP1-2-1b2 TaxID=2804675 RepID=UPI003CF7E50F